MALFHRNWDIREFLQQYFHDNGEIYHYKQKLSIRIKRMRNKNIYRKGKFLYDIRKAVAYDADHGKNIADLSDEEMSMFLINEG